MTSKQANMVGIDDVGDSSSGLDFRARKGFTLHLKPYAWPLVVDILLSNTTVTSHHYQTMQKQCWQLVVAVQEQQPQAHCHCKTTLLPTKQGIQFTILKEKNKRPAPSTLHCYSPDQDLLTYDTDCWLIFALKTGLAGKTKKLLWISSSRPCICKSSEIKTWCHTIFGVPQCPPKWLRLLQQCVDSNTEYFLNPWKCHYSRN